MIHCNRWLLLLLFIFYTVFFSLPLQEAVTDLQCLFQDELKCYSLENFLLPSHVSCGACSSCWKEESCAVKMLDGVSHSNRLYISNLETHISKFVSKICFKPLFLFLLANISGAFLVYFFTKIQYDFVVYHYWQINK